MRRSPWADAATAALLLYLAWQVLKMRRAPRFLHRADTVDLSNMPHPKKTADPVWLSNYNLIRRNAIIENVDPRAEPDTAHPPRPWSEVEFLRPRPVSATDMTEGESKCWTDAWTSFNAGATPDVGVFYELCAAPARLSAPPPRTGPALKWEDMTLTKAKMKCWDAKLCGGFVRRNVRTASDMEIAPTAFITKDWIDRETDGYVYKKSESAGSGDSYVGPVFAIKSRGRCLDANAREDRGKVPSEVTLQYKGPLQGGGMSTDSAGYYNSSFNPVFYYNSHCHGMDNQQFYFKEGRLYNKTRPEHPLSTNTNSGHSAMGKGEVWYGRYNFLEFKGDMPDFGQDARLYNELLFGSKDEGNVKRMAVTPIKNKPGYFDLTTEAGVSMTAIRGASGVTGPVEMGMLMDDKGYQTKAKAPGWQWAWFRPVFMTPFDAMAFVPDKYSDFSHVQLLPPEASKSGSGYDGCDTHYENRGGICYEQCYHNEDGDGTFGCYQKAPSGWKGGSTLTHLQKERIYSPGTTLGQHCPSDKPNLRAGLCYS